MKHGRQGERPTTLLERFRAKYVIDEKTSCWIWIAATAKGYGVFWNGKRIMPAHVFSYETFVGPIPKGKQADHTCHNNSGCPGGECIHRRCVNWSHIEPVTIKENLLRGESPSAKCARQTHCYRGHPLSGDNLYCRRDQIGQNLP